MSAALIIGPTFFDFGLKECSKGRWRLLVARRDIKSKISQLLTHIRVCQGALHRRVLASFRQAYQEPVS
jgi:hypothetical protein